nr:MAG TPA: hypothetical protein [Caudoviricetes sp.]
MLLGNVGGVPIGDLFGGGFPPHVVGHCDQFPSIIDAHVVSVLVVGIDDRHNEFFASHFCDLLFVYWDVSLKCLYYTTQCVVCQ